MAKWITIEKRGAKVFYGDGNEFTVGTSVKVGVGSVELRQTLEAGLHVVRLSGTGRFSYVLRLTKDGEYRLGPKFGHRVKEAVKENDPIRRVLRLADVPVGVLKVMVEGEPLIISTYSVDLDRAYHVGATEWWYETDGKEQTQENSRRKVGNQFCADEVHASGTITGATYAVCVDRTVLGTGGTRKSISQVAVWPGCDPVKLAAVIAPVVFGDSDADFEFLQALQDLELARAWVAKHYQITSSTGANIRVGTSEYLLGCEYSQKPYALSVLLRRHGLILVQEFITKDVADFLAAREKVEVAAKYIVSHYPVQRVRRGNEEFLRYGDKSLNALPSGEHATLWSLFSGKGLFARVMEMALAGPELVGFYPSNRRIRETEEGWEADSHPGGVRIGTKADMISAKIHPETELGQALTPISELSRKATGVGGSYETTLTRILLDGGEAYEDCGVLYLKLQEGETKHFFLLMPEKFIVREMDEVWAVTATRSGDKVTFKPYEGKKRYTVLHSREVLPN